MKLKHYFTRPSSPRQHRLAVVGILAIASAGVLAATALPAVASGPPIAAISRSGDPVAALADDALSLLSSEGMPQLEVVTQAREMRPPLRLLADLRSIQRKWFRRGRAPISSTSERC